MNQQAIIIITKSSIACLALNIQTNLIYRNKVYLLILTTVSCGEDFQISFVFPTNKTKYLRQTYTLLCRA